MDKKKLRKIIINNRDSLSLESRKKKDKLILDNLMNSEMYNKSTNIFTFINFGSEVETKLFISKAIESGKRIFVPKTIKETREMKAVEIKCLENLESDKWGVLEPKTFDEEIDKESLDLIIVPGVAFDRSGNRMGYGGGYYDRYFSDISYKINKVALAYEIQLLEFLETESHDVSVDYIITEKEIVKVRL